MSPPPPAMHAPPPPPGPQEVATLHDQTVDEKVMDASLPVVHQTIMAVNAGPSANQLTSLRGP